MFLFKFTDQIKIKLKNQIQSIIQSTNFMKTMLTCYFLNLL